MLKFYSASTRMVNTRRGVMECMEIALGEDYSDCDLIILHASGFWNNGRIRDDPYPTKQNHKILHSDTPRTK